MVTTLVLKNVPRITAYLADTSPTLDFDLSLPETEFTSLFGTMPPCQKEQNPLQNGKISCKSTTRSIYFLNQLQMLLITQPNKQNQK